MGRLLLEDVGVGASFGQSRVEALGGLRAVNLEGFFGGMELLTGGSEDVAVRATC